MNGIFDPKTDIIDLSQFLKDKSKRWLIFYKKDCQACKTIKEYFMKNNIRHLLYDLDTMEGLAMATACEVIEECKKWVPVIIYDEWEKEGF